MTITQRIYGRLARAFPHEFKMAHGRELIDDGAAIEDGMATRNDRRHLISLVVDAAIRLPLEYLDEIRRDARYTVRAMIKSPGFALVAIISMGLAVGLTTVVYNSKWRVITSALPTAANADRLVMPEKPVSYPYIEQFREQKSLFAGVSGFQPGIAFNVGFTSDPKANPERVFGQLVSPDYFSVLGVKAQRGRVLDPTMDRPGDAPTVVISDRFWRTRLDSSPDVIGRMLRLNGQPVTIVGIGPKGFNGAASINPSELFVPVTVPATLAPELANDVLHRRDAKDFLALICLAPGVTAGNAEAALNAIIRRLDDQDVSLRTKADKSEHIALLSAGTMVPLPRKFQRIIAGFFLVLMGLIMTIACINLANMMLARAVNRRKELAIRLAVGASRFRIVRQMINEGLLLSSLGGISGFALAYGIARLKAHFVAPIAVPVESDFTPDWHAAVFVCLLAVVSGIGFSLAPALRATTTDLISGLKPAGLSRLPGHRWFGLRNLLIIGQVTGSLVLLLVTGFLVMGFTRATGVPTRFDPHTMYLLSIDPVRQGYSPEHAKAVFEKVVAKLKNSGEVRGVALAAQPPFSLPDEDALIRVTAEPTGSRPTAQISVLEQTVGADYFSTLAEPMLAGREFSDADQRGEQDTNRAIPAILNETAARRLGAVAGAIGQRVRDDKQLYEVVGVVPDLKDTVGTTRSLLYVPLTPRTFARPPADGITLLVRLNATGNALFVRQEVASTDANLAIFNLRTLSDYLDQSRSANRLAIDTYGLMGLFGLILAGVGLAGVTAYAVTQRRKEIGIRMAVGARKGQVLRLVLREATGLISIGTALGFLGAFALARSLSSVTSTFADMLNIGTSDPRLLIGAPVLLASLAMIACYLPARRAAQIDPLKALRED